MFNRHRLICILDDKVLVFRNSTAPYVDLRRDIPDLNEMVKLSKTINRSSFTLASSCWGTRLERITLSDSIVARLEGKSSLGRIGLLIHSTAGFVDPGWDGNLTLELSNVSQIAFNTLQRECRSGRFRSSIFRRRPRTPTARRRCGAAIKVRQSRPHQERTSVSTRRCEGSEFRVRGSRNA